MEFLKPLVDLTLGRPPEQAMGDATERQSEDRPQERAEQRRVLSTFLLRLCERPLASLHQENN